LKRRSEQQTSSPCGEPEDGVLDVKGKVGWLFTVLSFLEIVDVGLIMDKQGSHEDHNLAVDGHQGLFLFFIVLKEIPVGPS
jgi:hypothetical protein